MPMEATAYTKAFSSLTAPRLEDFSIMITPSISVFSEQSEDLRIIRDVHMLQSLTVKGFPFPYDCASDWRNLTFLNVRGFQPAYTQFSQLFQSAPLLETVYLPTLRWVPDLAVNVKDVPVIEAPALKDLRVGLAGGHDDTRCECPLSLLLMPNLQSLAVIGDEHAYCSLAHHFSSEYVTNNFTKLTHLLLVCLSLTPRDVHFFRRLDNLRRLELDGVDGELSLNLAEGFRLGNSGEIKVPLPSLEVVTIFDAVEVDIGWLEKRASVQSSQLTIGMRDLPAELEATTSSLMKYRLIGEGPLYFPRDLSDPWNDGVFEPDDDDDFGDDEDDFEVYSDYDAFDDLDVEEDAFEYYNHEDGYEDYEDMEDLYAAI
ncbi:hypothetical protein V5O48_003269 [Marasmius crinis-equi]|uniref:Uncharacterized protein n=1 Tax=Marasmius crinis-equi TaxID=585013 RepID=A0ABR3FT99_9AGAR